MSSFIVLLTIAVFAVTVMFVFMKWFRNYRKGKITRGVFMRNFFLETFGILFATTLAGLLGRYIAEVVTAQITDDIARLIASILIGFLAGICVVFSVKRTWGRLLKA